MRIAVIGAGAMGSVFGGLLAEGGHEVWLVDVWAEHVRAIEERGLSIEGEGRTRTVRVRATTSARDVGTADLMLVFVKSYHTRAAVKSTLPIVGEDTLVLTLQNGLGNAETIAELVGPERVVAGVTAHGATMLGPGRVRHAGVGDTHVGELSGEITPGLRELALTLSAAGIATEASADVLSLLWSKIIINVGINPLTAITGLRNGQLLDYPATEELMELAVQEAVAVAAAKGIRLMYDDPVKRVKEVARATGQNRSSMLQDLERGRPTEIDAINGAVVRAGEELGVSVPTNRVLTLLVKALEQKGPLESRPIEGRPRGVPNPVTNVKQS